jgi:hypothetical protein
MLDASTGTTTWTTLAGGVAISGLVSVTENGNAGHRLATSNATNHGDIGSGAVDLSIQTNTSTTTGATGEYAFAMGENTTASGHYSKAWGFDTRALHSHTTAWGFRTTASKIHSTAWGSQATASGEYSTAWGSQTTASDNFSTAWGSFTMASGDYSTTWGKNSKATRDYSTAWGEKTTASASYSTAWGKDTTASGGFSTAWGNFTTAESYAQTTLGYFNSAHPGSPNPNTAQITDRLLVVGNGTSLNPSDAMVMLKNGNTTLDGNLTLTSGHNYYVGTTSLTVPDYVFETYFEGFSSINPKYEMLSLSEIETFVKEYKHLPGVKSHKEVQMHGKWDLIENIQTNLEKVEELYLHTIEQQKQINQQKQVILKLMERIEVLEKK